jgi:hypothetical protein
MYSYGFPPPVDIGQVGNEQEAVNAYVQAGRSKIMFTTDDQTVYVKCVSMNGQTSMDIFDRRAVQAPLPPPEYVTREELNSILEALKTPKKAVKTEVKDEPV